MSVATPGRFPSTASHGQTFVSHPGKAGGLPFFGQDKMADVIVQVREDGLGNPKVTRTRKSLNGITGIRRRSSCGGEKSADVVASGVPRTIFRIAGSTRISA